jgi:CubicO group peptidase (beta-lactamase class C family)
MSFPYAAGSMYSTVRDMHKWDRALYTNKLLTDDSKERMYTDHESNYGYGWFVRDVKLRKTKTGRDAVFTIGHGGGINGFNTSISRDPENEYVIVVLNNASPSPATGLVRDIYNILFAK